MPETNRLQPSAACSFACMGLALALTVGAAYGMTPGGVSTDKSGYSSLSAKERVNSCDPAIAIAAAHELLSAPTALKQPIEWFSPAGTLYSHGQRDEALFWFFAAQLRTRYQMVFEKGDLPQVFSMMVGTIGPTVTNYGFANPELMLSTFDRVLEWDRKTSNPWAKRPRTPQQESEIAAIYSSFSDLRRKVESEGPTLKAQADSQAKLSSQTQVRTGCKPGQMDPALVPETRRKEMLVVQQWVTEHAEIVRVVGPVERTSVDSWQGYDDKMPRAYSVSVYGAKTVYVEMTVDRTASPPRYNITCISPISWGARDTRGPKCPQ